MKSSISDYVLVVVSAIVSLDFIKTPLTNDARIYIGVEHLAAQYYPFPQNIDICWEIKPIGNRLINYIIYKLASVFAPFEDHAMFGVAVKFIALIAVLLIAAYFAHTLQNRPAFWITLLAFLTCANFCILQAEWWACLLAILAVALIASGKTWQQIAAGFLLVFILLIKGISGLLFIPIVCMVYLLAKPQQKAIVNVLAGCLSGFALFCITAVTIWKNMIPDIFLAPQLAKVGIYTPIESVMYFVMQLVVSPIYIPVLLPGFFAAVLYWVLVKHTPAEKVAFALMWLVPAVMVLISSEFFLYHYFWLVLPAIATLILSLERIP